MLLRPLTYLKAHHARPRVGRLDHHIIDGDWSRRRIRPPDVPPRLHHREQSHRRCQSISDGEHVKHTPSTSVKTTSSATSARTTRSSSALTTSPSAPASAAPGTSTTSPSSTAATSAPTGRLLWVREGMRLMPLPGYLHPRSRSRWRRPRRDDLRPSRGLPGGEQTIIATMQSATWMMTALWRAHEAIPQAPRHDASPRTWTKPSSTRWRARSNTPPEAVSALANGVNEAVIVLVITAIAAFGQATSSATPAPPSPRTSSPSQAHAHSGLRTEGHPGLSKAFATAGANRMNLHQVRFA